jgi:Na+-transporting methylmalonyl-CoA/oxaloacetate decarboxylase gamma subunit
MNNFLEIVKAGKDFEKGIFLMVVGILFVFAVQLVFYMLIKMACRFQKGRDREPAQKTS